MTFEPNDTELRALASDMARKIAAAANGPLPAARSLLLTWTERLLAMVKAIKEGE